jgi:hypothetical protein
VCNPTQGLRTGHPIQAESTHVQFDDNGKDTQGEGQRVEPQYRVFLCGNCGALTGRRTRASIQTIVRQAR